LDSTRWPARPTSGRSRPRNSTACQFGSLVVTRIRRLVPLDGPRSTAAPSRRRSSRSLNRIARRATGGRQHAPESRPRASIEAETSGNACATVEPQSMDASSKGQTPPRWPFEQPRSLGQHVEQLLSRRMPGNRLDGDDPSAAGWPRGGGSRPCPGTGGPDRKIPLPAPGTGPPDTAVATQQLDRLGRIRNGRARLVVPWAAGTERRLASGPSMRSSGLHSGRVPRWSRP